MTKGEQEKETEPFQTSKERCHETTTETFSDLDTGWAWAVLFASFGTFCVLGAEMYAVGIVHTALLQRYVESVYMTSWAGALHTALFGFGGPVSSVVIDKYSCRTALILSGILSVIGYIGTAFAETIEVAIFTCGIIAGTGGAFGYTTAMVVVSFNFKRRRSLALGIAVSGVGAGVFILSPLMQLSRDHYGPVGFFIILAAMAAERTNLMYQYLPSYVVSKGFTALEAAFLISLSGILSVIGRLLTGIIANLNRLNVIYLSSGSIGMVSIACFIYPFMSTHFAGHVIFVVLFGLFFGSCYVLLTDVTLQFVGINYISAAIGLQFFFGGFGSIIGPVLAGFLVDMSGTYKQAILIAASCILFSALSSAVTVFCDQKHDTVLHKDTTITVIDIQREGNMVRTKYTK